MVNIDHDIFVLVANVFPKSMNIKSGKVFAVCEPVTKIFHHKNVCDNSNEEVKRNLEIAALKLGHLTDHFWKAAKVSAGTEECLYLESLLGART